MYIIVIDPATAPNEAHFVFVRLILQLRFCLCLLPQPEANYCTPDAATWTSEGYFHRNLIADFYRGSQTDFSRGGQKRRNFILPTQSYEINLFCWKFKKKISNFKIQRKLGP